MARVTPVLWTNRPVDPRLTGRTTRNDGCLGVTCLTAPGRAEAYPGVDGRYPVVGAFPISGPGEKERVMIATMPVTREEMVQRATALVPRLRERAERTEQLRRLPDETVADLVDAGLLRISTPDRFGGLGLDF